MKPRPSDTLSASARDPDGALRTVVAFANTSGGTLLIGVEDRSRHVRGVFNVQAPEALKVKGRAAPVEVYRAGPVG